MTYLELQEFLSAEKLNHDQMDKIWRDAAEWNWKVANLIKCGKHWSEINRSALESLLRLNKERAESEAK